MTVSSARYYTGEVVRMAWATKRFFTYRQACGAPAVAAGRCFDFVYEVPEQEAEHQRIKYRAN